MRIEVRRSEYSEIEPLRELYRSEANCQIVHDSILRRGLADAYLVLVDCRVAGYGGVSNRHDVGRLMELYTMPIARPNALPICREVIAASGATSMEAQTNMPLMLGLLLDCAGEIHAENVLFADGFTTKLSCPNALFRLAATAPEDRIFEHRHEPVGEWVIEANGVVAATGGFLCHYNPPYGDIYMEVDEDARRKGYGSFLVQELKRACYEAGKRPAARCDVENVASRATLTKAGLLPCARMLVGKILQ